MLDRIAQDSISTTSYAIEDQLLKLEIKRTFWKNRLHMARDESLDLALDLEDSLLTLEIKGVTVRECKIKKFFINQRLEQLRKDSTFLHWHAQPFALIEEWSNIPKEPVKVKQIGVNDSTTENLLDFYKEDIKEVEVVLNFSNKLSLYMGQKLNASSRDSIPTNLSKRDILKKDLYLLMIDISASDAKAIYRSISDESELSLRY